VDHESVARTIEPANLKIVPEARTEPAGFVFGGALEPDPIPFKALELRRVVVRREAGRATSGTPAFVVLDGVGAVAIVEEGRGVGTY
jgi:hypothetical protein